MSENVSIDKVDIQILKALMKDPRTNFTEIARSCNMSLNTIRTRFKRLENVGVITGSILQINPKCFGKNCNGVIRIQTDFKEGEEFLEFLGEIPELVTALRQIGKYNISTFFSLTDYSELDGIVQRIQLQPNVLSVDIGVWVDVVNVDHPENLILEPTNSQFLDDEALIDFENEHVSSPINHNNGLTSESNFSSCFELDKRDIAILNAVYNNARMSFRMIATKTGIPTNTVIERYNKLKKIMPFSALTLNLEKIGYMGIAALIIAVSNHHVVSNVFDKILRVPNVIIAYRTLGTFQITVGIPFRNLDQLLKCYNRISEISGIVQIELFLSKPFTSWPLNLFSKLIHNKQ